MISIVIIIQALFTLIGLRLIWVSSSGVRKWWRCSYEVQGTCLGYTDSEGYEFKENEEIDCRVAPIYEYTYGEKTYKTHPTEYTLELPYRGARVPFKINPDKPEEVQFIGEVSNSITGIAVGIGLCFFLFYTHIG